MRRAVLVLAGSFAVAAAAATGVGSQDSSVGAADLTPDSAGSYVALAGAFALHEFRSAEMVLERSQDPQLQEYASAVTRAYSDRIERLLEAGRHAGIPRLDPAMLPMHWDLLRDLEDEVGTDFDEAFTEQQVEMHELAVPLHGNYALSGDSEPLRQVAGVEVRVARDHLARARRFGDVAIR